MKSFRDRVALVTGAASGIGRAVAVELAARGADLVLADIDAAGLANVAAEVGALGIESDVAKKGDVERLAASAIAAKGRVDLLINNAGVAVVAPLGRMTLEDWEWIVEVNLWGPIRLIHALLPSMLARRSGHVVNVASLAGLIGAPGMAAYSSTKFGLVGLSEALRLEVADQGVDVTVVCPGYVRTNLVNATRYKNAGFEGFLRTAPGWYGVDAAVAARRICDGIARREGSIVFGPERVGWLLKRISPEAAFVASRWMARRLGVIA